MVTKESEVFAKIVIAGDPKQLEAVTKCQVAESYGFSESYLEYLTQLKLYQPTPEYDPRFITFLVKNYRSHASILFVPNRLFYGNRLEACASPGNVFFNYFFTVLLFFFIVFYSLIRYNRLVYWLNVSGIGQSSNYFLFCSW